MYIQYKKKSDDDKWWWDFGGWINPARNYAMFGILARVRISDIPHFFQPKVHIAKRKTIRGGPRRFISLYY